MRSFAKISTGYPLFPHRNDCFPSGRDPCFPTEDSPKKHKITDLMRGPLRALGGMRVECEGMAKSKGGKGKGGAAKVAAKAAPKAAAPNQGGGQGGRAQGGRAQGGRAQGEKGGAQEGEKP